MYLTERVRIHPDHVACAKLRDVSHRCQEALRAAGRLGQHFAQLDPVGPVSPYANPTTIDTGKPYSGGHVIPFFLIHPAPAALGSIWRCSALISNPQGVIPA
jgi:hypothetical protein